MLKSNHQKDTELFYFVVILKITVTVIIIAGISKTIRLNKEIEALKSEVKELQNDIEELYLRSER